VAKTTTPWWLRTGLFLGATRETFPIPLRIGFPSELNGNVTLILGGEGSVGWSCGGFGIALAFQGP
jgi:hypothetical protein